MAVSDNHCVSPKGKYIAIVSTTVETNDPVKECAPGLKLLEPIEERCEFTLSQLQIAVISPSVRFVSISDTYTPTGGHDDKNIFISQSMDATR